MAGMALRSLNMKQYHDKIAKLMVQRLKAVEAGDFEHNIPTFVWGPPGIGKSKIIEAVCRDTWKNAMGENKKPLFDPKWLQMKRPWDAAEWLNYTDEDRAKCEKAPDAYLMMDVRLSQVDPVEIKGAPFYDVKSMKAFFIRFSSILPDPKSNRPIYLLLDELPLAPDMVQAAGYQLINDRKVGDYRLPAKCVVIAAGNRPEDGGMHFEMSMALENRFDHIALDIDYKGFVKYIAANHGYDDTLVAFLQFSCEQDKQALYKLDQGKGNFPTFRSWEKAARKIKYGEPEYDSLADSVGGANAAKFSQFKELTKDIPPAEQLVDKKLYYADVAKQLVASQKVGNHVINPELNEKLSNERMFEFFKYFLEMKNPKDVNDNREELTILFLTNLKEHLDPLERVGEGFQKALKKGTFKQEKNPETGEPIVDIYGLIFVKWKMLQELD